MVEQFHDWERCHPRIDALLGCLAGVLISALILQPWL